MHFVVKTIHFVENKIKFDINKIFTKVFNYKQLQKKHKLTSDLCVKYHSTLGKA